MSKYGAICLTDRRPKMRGGTRQGRPIEKREALFYFSLPFEKHLMNEFLKVVRRMAAL